MDEPELGAPLGAGKEAEVFACGPGRVAKLYRSPAAKPAAFREAAILSLVERLRLPAPRVHGVGSFGGRWGLVIDRVEGPAFAAAFDEGPAPSHLQAMVALQRELHATSGAGLPDLKASLAAKLGRAELLSDPQSRRLIEQLAALPEGDRLCHGDFHPWNVLGMPGAASVIDWLDATQGPPAADVGRSFLLLSRAAPALAQPYLDTYVAASGIDPAAVAAWMPVLAGARLSEGVPGETEALLALVRAC